jgi:hypothetical protein
LGYSLDIFRMNPTILDVGGGGPGSPHSNAVGAVNATTTGTYTITTPNGPTPFIYTTGGGMTSISSADVTSSALEVRGDIIMDGQSLKKIFEGINDRLLVLVPDPAKLEKWEALKIAYENFKLMESLLRE